MTAPAKPNLWDRIVRALSSYSGLLLLILIIGVYGLVVLWAADLVIQRTRPAPKAAVVAAAELPAGHLLRPSDVQLPGLNGYTKRRIERGKPIVAGDLTPTPNLSVPAGSMLAVLPVTPALLDVDRPGRIDVGSTVHLCARNKPPMQATVQAVICGATGCAVALPVRADRTGALDGATVRPLSSQPCG